MVPEAGGTLLVSDFQNSRVLRLDPEGKILQSFGRHGLGQGELWRVRGLASLADGGVAVVNHKLSDPADPDSLYQEAKVFGPDGRERLAFSLAPPGEEEAGWPEGIVWTPQGYVVADSDRDALIFINEEGEWIRTMDQLSGGEALEGPQSPIFDGEALWFAEYRAHRVRRISLDGEPLLSVGEEGEEPGQFLFPQAVGVAADGSFFVADLGNWRVQRFDATGKWLSQWSPPARDAEHPLQLVDLAVAADGSLWLADSKGDRVIHGSAEGVVLGEIHSIQ